MDEITNQSICCQNQEDTTTNTNNDNDNSIENYDNTNTTKSQAEQAFYNKNLTNFNRAISLFNAGYSFKEWSYLGMLNKSLGHQLKCEVTKLTYDTGSKQNITVGYMYVDILANPNRYMIWFKSYTGEFKYKNFPSIVAFKNKFDSIIKGNTISEKDMTKASLQFEKILNGERNESSMYRCLYNEISKMNKFNVTANFNNKYKKEDVINYLKNGKYYAIYLNKAINDSGNEEKRYILYCKTNKTNDIVTFNVDFSSFLGKLINVYLIHSGSNI